MSLYHRTGLFLLSVCASFIRLKYITIWFESFFVDMAGWYRLSFITTAVLCCIFSCRSRFRFPIFLVSHRFHRYRLWNLLTSLYMPFDPKQFSSDSLCFHIIESSSWKHIAMRIKLHVVDPKNFVDIRQRKLTFSPTADRHRQRRQLSLEPFSDNVSAKDTPKLVGFALFIR